MFTIVLLYYYWLFGKHIFSFFCFVFNVQKVKKKEAQLLDIEKQC